MQTPLCALRSAMNAQGIQAVLVPTSDFHGNEYTGAHFACRAYVSGFTGSAGTLLVLSDWAGLWTDGRYFLQAEQELSGSGITLMREGQPDTPSLERVLVDRLKEGACLAFDGRCVSAREGQRLLKLLTTHKLRCRTDVDLVGSIWPNRPPCPVTPAWQLAAAYSGTGCVQKVARLRTVLTQKKAACCLLAAPEEIAWLLNLRGRDIDTIPVVLSFMAITQEEALLFAQPDAFSEALRQTLANDGISLRPYDAVYAYAADCSPNGAVLLDGRRVNYHLRTCLPSTTQVLDCPSPVEAFKAVKDETEIQNMRQAHVKDGIALTKFLYQVKNKMEQPLSERAAASLLESLRQEQAHYLGPSFAPIIAYGAHGAMVHYSATPESDVPLLAEGFVLMDTGGHYLEGTTDCTRTLSLGPLTQEQKTHYTAVLRGHLNLAAAQFLHGCTGANLDYLARAPLWAMQLDYRHGTGHGVGFLLSVHEGPQQIRWRQTPGAAVLEAGMITSDEPGLYLDGAYGIRLENLLLCTPRGESDYGQFLGFEALTLVPFDPDAIDPTQMSPDELRTLNQYHQRVYETISPHLTPAEAAWLAYVTRPLA